MLALASSARLAPWSRCRPWHLPGLPFCSFPDRRPGSPGGLKRRPHHAALSSVCRSPSSTRACDLLSPTCGCQGETQPGPAPLLQAALGQEGPSEGSLMPRALACNLSEPSWRLMPPPSLSLPSFPMWTHLPSWSFWKTCDVAQPQKPQLSLLSPEAEWISHACPSSPLDLLSPGNGCLLEDSLEGVLEDIDTSVFDCDLWLPTSLPNFKETFCSPGEQVPGLADHLDCLMNVLVGVQEL